MLATPTSIRHFPVNFHGLAVNQDDQIKLSKADENITVCLNMTGIAMRVFMPMGVRSQWMLVVKIVILNSPFPDNIPFAIDLP